MFINLYFLTVINYHWGLRDSFLTYQMELVSVGLNRFTPKWELCKQWYDDINILLVSVLCQIKLLLVPLQNKN